jgi:hypothetical protein
MSSITHWLAPHQGRSARVGCIPDGRTEGNTKTGTKARAPGSTHETQNVVPQHAGLRAYRTERGALRFRLAVPTHPDCRAPDRFRWRPGMDHTRGSAFADGRHGCMPICRPATDLPGSSRHHPRSGQVNIGVMIGVARYQHTQSREVIGRMLGTHPLPGPRSQCVRIVSYSDSTAEQMEHDRRRYDRAPTRIMHQPSGG